MARINIEDTLDDDPRFQYLQKLVGRQTAYGVWRDVAKQAQQYWKKDRSLIPKHIFKFIENHQAMVDSDLVEEHDHGFKLVGSEEAFAWLIQKVNAGKKGGSSKNNTLDESGGQRNETTVSDSKPLTLTLTPSQPLALVQENKKTPIGVSHQPAKKAEVGAIEQLAGDPEVENFLADIKRDQQQRWLRLYDSPDFIKQELLKAIIWLADNPQRAPRAGRGKSSFLTKWFGRGWERHRKTIQTNTPSPDDDMTARLNEIRRQRGKDN